MLVGLIITCYNLNNRRRKELRKTLEKKIRKIFKKYIKEKEKNVKRKVVQEHFKENSDRDDDLNCLCLVCCETYATSKSNEEWIQLLYIVLLLIVYELGT